MLSRLSKPARVLPQYVSRSLGSAAPATEKKVFTSKSEEVFNREDKYGAHNYHPLPVALSRGEGKCQELSIFLSLINH